MKTTIFALALVLGVAAAQVDYELEFTNFMTQFERTYDADEFFHRFHIFQDNLNFVNAHNAGDHLYTLGINQFSDMTSDEMAEMTNGWNAPSTPRATIDNTHYYNGEELADSVDWRTKNVVTPVKNQGMCGSCWAFSTTGSFEGANAISTGKLLSLSEQELVSCAGSSGNLGCNGGLMDDGFKWIHSNDGLCSEADYPYTSGRGSTGKCQVKKNDCKSVATLSSFKDVDTNEDALASALASGPVSIAIEADQRGFQAYKSGIFDGKCGQQLDHGVLLVGYGTEDGTDYWIVKNSWGASWGDEGYIRLKRGMSPAQCGIDQCASYPTI